MSYRVLPFGIGRYDIGPYAKEFLFQTEANPTSDWTERSDSAEDLWTKRPDTTQETWILLSNGTN